MNFYEPKRKRARNHLEPLTFKSVDGMVATQPQSNLHQANNIDSKDGNVPPRDNNHRIEDDLIERLAKERLEQGKVELLICLRNLLTNACNRRLNAVRHPNFKIVEKLIDDDTNQNNRATKTQVALLLCGIAKSGGHVIEILNDLMVDAKIYKLLLNSLDNNDDELIEASLRCLRSVMSWPKVSRTSILYDHQQFESGNLTKDALAATQCKCNLEKIINHAINSPSFIVQECVGDLFAATCTTQQHQTVLHKASALPCAIQMLESPSTRVIIAGLNWLTQMCLKNLEISLEITRSNCPSGRPVFPDKLTRFMNQANFCELQLVSAECFTTIYSAMITSSKEEPRVTSSISSYAIPTLVRMLHKDKPKQFNIRSAETLASLIKCSTKMQYTAFICDNVILHLADMLEYENNPHSSHGNPQCRRRITYREIMNDLNRVDHSTPPPPTPTPPTLDLSNSQLDTFSSDSSPGTDVNIQLNKDLKRAAFLALASLASNLEPIRKRIFSTCSVMQHLVKALTDNDITLKPALICLLSLSRSVEHLRTSFAENSVYTALKNIIYTSTTSEELSEEKKEILVLVTAVFCNVSLEFSSTKQKLLLDKSIIDMFCKLASSQSTSRVLKINAYWLLMNFTYQLNDLELKIHIINALGISSIINTLETTDEELLLKTLGLLRNLLSQRAHIDSIMKVHGDYIIAPLIGILEKRSNQMKIKEQTLCVLTNIADGLDAKKYIINNRTVLSYLSKIICDEQAGDLRLAAICCVTNLALKECEKSNERRDELKKLGIDEMLKKVLNSNDPVVSNRAKTAYDQFASM